ncbi:MAG: hypothetical protein A2163_07785 [Actinobacteria bacterium RBG_13_35_12]|nr:MAG: hypothetical protein A2163_07785 [Actinobacteria bacterium RBG_13_35_12]
MIELLSKDQIKDLEKQWKLWWLNLSFNTRSRIYHLINPYFQKECKHKFIKEKDPFIIKPVIYRKRCKICDLIEILK